MPIISSPSIGDDADKATSDTTNTARLGHVAGLDAVLFRPEVFTIDAVNDRVCGYDSHVRAVAALERTSATAVVGTLRDGFTCVDVDLDGERGFTVQRELQRWAGARGLWVLIRDSGGGLGRAHVFLERPEDQTVLLAFVVSLRRVLGASARDIDIRRDVRLLQSPHRTGVITPTLVLDRETIDAAQRIAERDRLGVVPVPRVSNSASTPSTPGVSGTPSTLGVRVAPRALPRPWSDWLAGGGAPPPIGGRDGSRSAVEVVATGHLKRAGLTCDEAWQLICDAHPDAMSKARGRGKAWWVKYLWERVSTMTSPEHAAAPASRQIDLVHATLLGAHFATLCVWARDNLAVRRRPAVIRVGIALLERASREESLSVPCAIRDLQIDTGLSQPTIINALRSLDGVIGVRDFSPHHADRTKAAVFVFLPAPSTKRPPTFSTMFLHPLAVAWLALPVNAALAWHLPPDCGLSLYGVLSCTPAAAETLQRLVQAYHCPGQGGPDLDLLDAARNAQALLVARVTRERQVWRNPRRNTWQAQRVACHRVTVQRARTWWESLDPAEQAARREKWREVFHRLPPSEQARVKTRLAERRAAAGINERERYEHWRRTRSTIAGVYCPEIDDLYNAAAAQRWQSLPPQARQEKLQLLHNHRHRWNLPKPHARVMPVTSYP